jgi:cytochrome c-type biogenesis protein
MSSSVGRDVTALLAASLAAGMVATVNPCGFAMLPAYLGMIIGDRGSGRRSALLVGGAVSTGFVTVFLMSGVLVASGLRIVVTWIPWMALVIGLGLVAVGIAELRGAHLFARLPGVKRSSRIRSVRGLIGFGASYGVASLSCTLPIFLSLVAGTVATGSFAESIAVFAAYGAGMSLVVIVLTLALAAGRDRLLIAIRPISARLGTISGWIMIIAGAFIVWYWATVLMAGAVDLGSNPVVRLVDALTARVAGFVSSRPLFTAFGVMILGLVTWRLTRPPKGDARDASSQVAPVENRSP